RSAPISSTSSSETASGWRPTVRKALLLLLACGRVALGPQPIPWDREACAGCHMLISDPAFAAQVVDGAGRALSFDDPGCLLAWPRAHPARAAIWSHHHPEARWLAPAAAGFISVAASPMGYRLAVVDAGAPGARGFQELHASAQP